MRFRRDHTLSSVQQQPDAGAPSGLVSLPAWKSTREQTTVVTRLLTWAGSLVFALGGAGLAAAPLHHRPPIWWYAASALLLVGISLIASGARARSRPRLASGATPPADELEPRRDPDVLVPMLGALLVYKYRSITEWELEKALEMQRKLGKQRKRLGEILVEMGMVTRSQLGTALDYQAAYVREKRARSGRSLAAPRQAHGLPQAGAGAEQAAGTPPWVPADDPELAELVRQ